MKTTCILTCKDLRRLLPFAIIWLVLIFVFFANSTAVSKTHQQLQVYLTFAAYAAGVFLISLIVHESPLSGTKEFWMTRPISGPQLFASKLFIVVLMCVLMPTLILALAKITGLANNPWITQTPRGPMTVIGHLPVLLGLALFFMLLASLTQNLVQYIFLILGLFMALMILTFSLSRADFSGQKHVIQNQNILEWTTSALFFPGLIFLICNQYTRRNRKVTVILSAFLALLIFGLWHFWGSPRFCVGKN